MASKEHQDLSEFIKSVHKSLRNESKKLGADHAWKQHLEQEKQLRDYAEAMKTLSESHWTKRDTEPNRIEWTVNSVREYFNNQLMKHREKEERILKIVHEENLNPYPPIPCYRRIFLDEIDEKETSKLRLLDVGSCFNPFKKYIDFEVTAVDIAPSTASGVFQLDFINVHITSESTFNICHNRLQSLPRNYFDIIVFSLLLEYLPSSNQRLKCLKNAYELLDNEGILIIITPDSKHVGVNAKLMKNWRYILAKMGFSRIKFEKMEHLTCMIFRKCIDQSVSVRWARIHKEEYMNDVLNIPQDFNEDEEENDL